jgi:hypothetical protein
VISRSFFVFPNEIGKCVEEWQQGIYDFLVD